VKSFIWSAIKAIVTGVIFLSFTKPVVSQTSNQGNFLSIDQLIPLLENKYPIQFFYKPEWFRNKLSRLPFWGFLLKKP